LGKVAVIGVSDAPGDKKGGPCGSGPYRDPSERGGSIICGISASRTRSDNLANPMKRKAPSVERKPRGFEVEAYLDATGGARTVTTYRRREVIFSQGDPGTDVRYLQKGAVKLSVLSQIGKEAVVAMLVPGDFFGEGVQIGRAHV